MVSFGGLGTLEDMAGDTLLYNLDANGVSEGSNESSGKTYRTKLTVSAYIIICKLVATETNDG